MGIVNTVIEMMNKQMVVFLRNYLYDKHASMTFINELMRNCVEPTLNHSAHKYKWDGDSNTLTTPDDDADKGTWEKLEAMPLFVNKTGEILGGGKEFK